MNENMLENKSKMAAGSYFMIKHFDSHLFRISRFNKKLVEMLRKLSVCIFALCLLEI
jgi:hypothetical protein